MLVVALALLVLLAGCGDEESPPAPDTISASVCDAVGGSVPDEVLALRGSVVPLSDLGAAAHPGSVTGFVLADGGCSIFVAAPDRAGVAGLEEGEQITVNGTVMVLDDVEAERLRRVLDLPRDVEVISDGVPSPTPIGPGAPFVDGFSLLGE